MTTLPSGRVVVTVTAQAAPGLRKAMADWKAKDLLCLHGEPDPEADSCLVWKPGAQRPTAISKPGGTGARMTGNHLMLVGDQAANEFRVFEDGFSFLLTSRDWARIREALASGRDLTLPGGDALPALVIRWMK